MTALSDALTAAQRSALAALEKAYVAGAIEAEAMVAALESAGISDPVDTAFLLSALDVLKEWGVAAPTTSRHELEAEVERLSEELRRARSTMPCFCGTADGYRCPTHINPVQRTSGGR